MNVASTLMIDLVPGQSSSVTACVRFASCLSFYAPLTRGIEQPHTLHAECRARLRDRAHAQGDGHRLDLHPPRRPARARVAFRVPRYPDRAGLSGQAAEAQGDTDGSGRHAGGGRESMMMRERANGRLGELDSEKVECSLLWKM